MKCTLSSLISTTSTFTKITAFSVVSVVSFSIFFLFKHFLIYPIATTQNLNLSLFNSTNVTTNLMAAPPPLPLPLPLPQEVMMMVERTGIINEMGVMTDDFIVGEFDEGLIQSVELSVNASHLMEIGEKKVLKLDKFRLCDESMSDYIPCLDNVEAIPRFNFSQRCGIRLDCLVPRPKGYKLHIPWPESRDKVWFDNMPITSLPEQQEGQNSKSIKHDKFIFPEGETSKEYLDQISKMVPEIAFGQHTRVALDIGSEGASFGAYLMDQNVTTLSISQYYVHDNDIQFALERGVPAMVVAFGPHRLPYPSQGFDLIHCSMCRINWTRNDGILLLEANRILRAGGYFVWAVAQPDENIAEHRKEMEDLTSHLCWEPIINEAKITIWQKPLNNTCYLNRDPNAQPSLCSIDENPENIWYANLTTCITRLPENGYGANITDWPSRLHSPPDRLFSIQMDADKSRRELYKADTKYWNDIVSGYVGAFHINDLTTRNVMDMKAGYGGFAVALLDFKVDCWTMNVVPISGKNTLPVIYDRGLIGVMHDWCEPFDTYPRTYDMLHAAGLFSVEKKRCDISNIMLEMDRVLRPGGRAYIRDTSDVIDDLHEIAKAMGWVTFIFDSGEGPHSNWKLITCEKRL